MEVVTLLARGYTRQQIAAIEARKAATPPAAKTPRTKKKAPKASEEVAPPEPSEEAGRG